ncbi:MAG: uroporphyrinogen-III synthase [Acidilobaceae archaeon]
MRSSRERAEVLVFSPDDSLLRDLEAEGVTARWIPLIELAPRRGASLEVLRALEECRVVAFTSPRALAILLEDAREQRVEDRLLEALRGSVVGVAGPKTLRAVEEALGRPPDVVAPEPYARSLAREIARRGYDCVVAARSAAGVREFAEELESGGVKLLEVPVYEPRVKNESIEILRERLENSKRLVLALTSPMIAEIVCSVLEEIGIRDARLVAIGATTARAVESRCPPQAELRVGDGTPATLARMIAVLVGSV